MTELLSFFKDIFMLNDSTSDEKIGLSQFNVEKPVEKKEKPQNKELSISDLMRRSA